MNKIFKSNIIYSWGSKNKINKKNIKNEVSEKKQEPKMVEIDNLTRLYRGLLLRRHRT